MLPSFAPSVETGESATPAGRLAFPSADLKAADFPPSFTLDFFHHVSHHVGVTGWTSRLAPRSVFWPVSTARYSYATLARFHTAEADSSTPFNAR